MHSRLATITCAMLTWECVIIGLSGCAGFGDDILETSGIRGGLVVHVGSGDGTTTSSLYGGDAYRVHGLDTSAVNVQLARERIRMLGLQGKVTFAQWTGTALPYIDNLVNLVVAEEPGELSTEEIQRVLAPNGVACVKRNGRWIKTIKPRPDTIDEWTHDLHDATGNPVAQDAQVGPPRHLQWIGGPKWSRHHDHMTSMTAMVSANGRLFYIMDEGSTESIQLPPRWVLTARDAFNGVVLWKKPIDEWYNHLFPVKSGPSQLPRRLVADGDFVYVTLGINAPVSALDAATGEVLRTYEGTTTAEEILFSNGALFLLVNPGLQPVLYDMEDPNCWNERDRASSTWGWDEKPRIIMSLNPKSGKINWRHETTVVPLSLASDGRRVVYHDGQSLVSREFATGQQQWVSPPIERLQKILTGYLPSLRLHEDVVLFSGKRAALTAVSTADGSILWSAETHRSGHYSPEDFFILDGLVWNGDISATSRPSNPTHSTGLFTGRDLHTGEIKKEFPCDAGDVFVMHQRCYPSKATTNYILGAWVGTEFIDPVKEHWDIHHWVRGSCVYGIMPANGMLYAPPNACACYYQSKLNGFAALAPARTSPAAPVEQAESSRLQQGPAYGTMDSGSTENTVLEWPTYRNNAARSGATQEPVSSSLTQRWKIDLGGQLSAPVAADGKLFVASVDEHTVHALDAQSGKPLWQFTAGGRIDSPPTIYHSRVLFGSADGWVYCLRASDGVLAWRYRAAPQDLRHIAFDQVESVWPVSGSVMVQDGVLYCVAGRMMFIDGGMRLLRLDPLTGRKLSETVLDDRDPETGLNLQSLIKGKKMPVALPDVLSSDGKYVYMRSQRFYPDGTRAVIAPEHQTDQEGEGIHLFSPLGFLDDTWFNRGYWIYGKNAGEGWGEWFIPGRLVPYGRILVYDDQHVYGFARDPEYLSNSSILEYRLFAAKKRTDPARVKKLKVAQDDIINWLTRSKLLREEQTAVDYVWLREHPPLLAKAMTLAGTILFVAGPPDVLDEKEAHGRFLYPGTRTRLDEQLAALNGSQGAVLWAASATDGQTLAEYRLEAPPRFDGMIAAYGALYIVLQNGTIISFGDEKSAD